MSEQGEEREASRRWSYVLLGVGILAVYSALVLWGLGWGAPSQRRARLEGWIERLEEELAASELSP